MESKIAAEVSPRKGARSRGHLVEHRAKRKQIGPRIQFLAQGLLRRHIRDCAQSSAGAGQILIAGLDRGLRSADRGRPRSYLGQAEIQNLRVAALGDENVRRLDVAVHYALRMSPVQRICDLDGDLEQCVQLHRPVADQMLQGGAIQKLHRNERPSVGLANVVYRADVGMIQRGCRFGLALETGQRLRIGGQIIRQKLQRHRTVQARVLRLIHHTHPASPKFFEEAIVRNGLADH